MYLISTGKSSSTSSIEITSLFTTHDFAARIFIDTPSSCRNKIWFLNF